MFESSVGEVVELKVLMWRVKAGTGNAEWANWNLHDIFRHGFAIKAQMNRVTNQVLLYLKSTESSKIEKAKLYCMFFMPEMSKAQLIGIYISLMCFVFCFHFNQNELEEDLQGGPV